MALQKQIVPISFGQGLDLKTDPKQVIQGKLLRIQNGTFQTPQEIRKRNGHTALSQTILGGTSIASGVGLESYKNELDLIDGNNFYGYNSSTGAQGWVNRGQFQPAKIETSPVISNNYNKSVISGAYNTSGMQAFHFFDGVSDFATNVIDKTTGQVLKNSVSTFNAVASAEVSIIRNFGNYFVTIAGVSPNLYALATSANNYFTTQTAVTGMPTDFASTTQTIDAVVVGVNLVVVYRAGANNINAFYINPSFVASSPVTVATVVTLGHVTVWTDASNRVWVAWNDSANSKYRIYNSDLTSNVLTTTSIETAGSGNIVNLTGTATTTNNSVIMAEHIGVNNWESFITIWNLTSAGIATSKTTAYSVQLAGKSFYYGTNVFFLAQYVSFSLQHTFFLYRFNGTSWSVVGKFEPGLAGNTVAHIPLAEAMNTASGVYEYPVQVKGELLAANGGVYTHFGIKNAKISLNVPLDSQDIANDLHVSGGQLWMYDSINVVEHGFHLFPENLATTATSASGGGMGTGSYEYVVVYEWTDAQGQIHQSAPSIPLTVVFGSGTTNQATVRTSTLRVTDKPNISNVLYRTTVNGSIFYRVTSVTSLQITVPTSGADYLTFPADTAADSAIVGNEQLYTNGGEVENIAVPNVLALTTYRNRLIVIPSEAPLTWWYSKQVIPNTPVAFSDLLVQNVDQRGGNMTALSVMDDKLIFFKLNQVFYVVGDGPAPNGSGNDYSDAQFISVDTGCSVKESVVLTPMGIMFQSPKGFYLLDRGLGVQYIGAEVEFYNDQTTTSAVLIANTTQVRFTLGNGVSLVYDYLVKQWEVFTNISAVASVNYQNLFTYLDSTGLVKQETPGVYTDNGTAIALSLETGWLSFAGLQGFQRVYELILLGEYKSTHTLLVEIYYDFETAVSQSTTITPTSTAPYQWSVMLKRQKCEAIKVRITEADTGTPAEGLSISAMTVEVGVKGGLNRVSAARSFE